MADQVLMPNLEMDFERILGVPFFNSSSHSIMLRKEHAYLLTQLHFILNISLI